MKSAYIFTLCLFSILYNLDGQVLINEYSASNLNVFLDNYNKTEDWVELYNPSGSPIDISGWYLSDKTSKPTKWMIPAGTIIQSNDFLVFWCSGRDESKNGYFHTNFKLSQTSGKDRIVLSDATGTIIQDFQLNITQADHSMCRATDGQEYWVVCTNPSLLASNDQTVQFAGYTTQPEMNMEAGFYSDSLSVTIINNEENSSLRYTLDGTNPKSDSPLYEAPISIHETTLIKAQSFSNDPLILPGKMDFNTYFINEDFTVAVFSVGADDVINLANGDGGLEPIGSLEYFDLNKDRKAVSFGSLNRHGQDSWVLPHRSIDWVSRDEMGYTKAVMAPLFSYSERDEYQRFMFRNSGDDNYPAIEDNAHEGSTHIRDEYVQTLAREGGMHLDTRAVERVVLFLNGQYWGLYGMRERPVDHDYTSYYYNQDKYNLHFLTTWGSTKAEYGGLDAFKEWYTIRDFVMENDMGLPENYDVLKSKIDMISFVDYFIVNLNVVAKDWLNYNTAWWRGLDQNETHTKWGYVLWDLDATFDYYINYTGIPNSNADAKPCDIQEISNYMDQFFSGGGGGNEIENPENCNTIILGTCPYPPEDTIFLQVINQDNYCCYNEWDGICQDLYNQMANDTLLQDTCWSILNGTNPYPMDDPVFMQTVQYMPSCCSDEWNGDCQAIYDQVEVQFGEESVSGNVGKHEKLFLKLQEENPEFRNMYYARQADMMNTVFSCENMEETLDKMLAVIEPEMPRQIDRWGGTIEEWQTNVERLRNFVGARCDLLDEGLVECFDLTGPYEISIQSLPEGLSEIKLNTIGPLTLPWTGRYFGEMTNAVQSKIKEEFESDYRFSHWESTSGATIIAQLMEENTDFELFQSDTLIAVYELITDTEALSDDFNLSVFPNPAKDLFVIEYYLQSETQVQMNLRSSMGLLIKDFGGMTGKTQAGLQRITIDLESMNIPSGVYFVEMEIEGRRISNRIVVME